MAKDYYLILGVNRDANPEEIKSAYRRAVKDHHPDVSKSPDKEKFIEIQEAYDVLKDPEKKKAYDESLKRAERKISPISRGYYTHFTRRRSDPFFPFFEDLFEDITSTFSRPFGAARKRIYTAEIILSPEEAEKGGYLPLTVPVKYPCHYCHGEGMRGFFRCPECLGTGNISSEISFRVKIPARVTHGTILDIDMEEIGIRQALLRLQIFIA